MNQSSHKSLHSRVFRVHSEFELSACTQATLELDRDGDLWALLHVSNNYVLNVCCNRIQHVEQLARVLDCDYFDQDMVRWMFAVILAFYPRYRESKIIARIAHCE